LAPEIDAVLADCYGDGTQELRPINPEISAHRSWQLLVYGSPATGLGCFGCCDGGRVVGRCTEWASESAHQADASCILIERGEAVRNVAVVEESNSWEFLLSKGRKNLTSLFP